jgi:hypothetical protein
MAADDVTRATLEEANAVSESAPALLPLNASVIERSQ